MKRLCIALALGFTVPVVGCPGGDAADAGVAAKVAPKRSASTDDVVSVVLPPDLIVHRHMGAVQGVSGDGSYRLHVERLPPERLIRLAATAKDAWTARGWEVSGEQHFERALFVAMRRGGGARNPVERREAWWIEGDGAVTLCDVLATRAAFERLGEPVQVGCQTIEVVAWPPDE